MSLRRKCRIKNVEVDGEYVTRRLTNKMDWESMRSSLDLAGFTFPPSWEALAMLGDRTKLWRLEREMVFTINFESGAWIQYKFLPGFIWDQASVPIFKDNDLQEIYAAMVHDANFSCHYLFPDDNNMGFRAANRVFREMTYQAIDDMDVSWFKRIRLRSKARRHYAAVSSVIGRAKYETESPRREFWHSKTVQFACSRNSEWGRKN